MNKKIIFFNVVYYVVVIGLLMRGRHDASSSLGYGYFIVIFLAIAAIALIYLLGKKNIHPKSLIDKIGVPLKKK